MEGIAAAVFSVLAAGTSAASTALAAEEPSAVSLERGWKLKTGDDLAWAEPAFDDASWAEIAPNRLWEDQGHARYDGYAWYRIRFLLPNALKESAFLKDTVEILLGKIDDTDQTFLNGRLVGQNNQAVPLASSEKPGPFEGVPGMYNVVRRYRIASDDPRLAWGRENVLAIRVHDGGGGGGMYSPRHEVRMVDVPDYLVLDKHGALFEVIGRRGYRKNLELANEHPRLTFKGTLNVSVREAESGSTVFDTTQSVTLAAGETREVPIEFAARTDVRSKVRYTFLEETSKRTIVREHEMPYLLTPPALAAPRINGPLVYGARPGRPFLFRIPVSGERPLRVAARGLPPGLILDPASGILTGSAAKAGEHAVEIAVENVHGRATGAFRIVIGDEVALTPPMGWNSWNCWGLSVSDEKVRQSADQMIASGLADHGWSFVNIDDGWEAPERAASGEIAANPKFPDMAKLAEYVHGRGLKVGIYSSPGPRTCGQFLGSYQHERQDALTWGRWGIDYLKYDWCSYGQIVKGETLEELQAPYRLMRSALDAAPRDIVYSLCQYGMGKVWEWGASVGGNLWRTTGDIEDTWESLRAIGFEQTEQHPYASPGHWNDPDMLIVGWVGWGPSLRPTQLTPSEQYTHISLWSLLSAPLLLGCDLSRLDAFTLNLLTNDEVLAVDQDPLGAQARRVTASGDAQVWAKGLADGSRAVGLFNLGEADAPVSIRFSELGLAAPQQVRDLWRQKDLGSFRDRFEARVPAHGVVLVRLTAAR